MRYKIINDDIVIHHYVYQFFLLIFISALVIFGLAVYEHLKEGNDLFNPFSILAIIVILPSLLISLMWKKYTLSSQNNILTFELMMLKKPIKKKVIDLSEYEGIAWGKNGMSGSNTVSSLNIIHKIPFYSIYGLVIERWHENAEVKAKEFAGFLGMKYLGEVNNMSMIHKTYV